MNEYNPNHYIELKDDSAMIQAAVDAARETGETVFIPRFNKRTGKHIWIITRAILLHSNSVICLNNCHLRLADDVFCNIFKNSNGRTQKAKTVSGRQYDIRIYGLGNAVLDGGMHNGLTERTQNENGLPSIVHNTTIHFHNAERVVVENIRILHSRWWGITFHYCSSCRVSNIDFMSVSNAPNQDGIDLRTGCCSFIIENITGFTQDDTVALTNLAHPFDNVMHVDNLDDSIHNVVIRNITTAAKCAKVRLLNHDRKKLYNIIIENIQDYAETDPAEPFAKDYEMRIPHSKEFVVGSETSMAVPDVYWANFDKDQRPSAGVIISDDGYYRNKDNPELPSGKVRLNELFNITIRNVQTRADYGILVTCTLADSLIDNVQMFGNPITAVHFREGIYRNIRLSNISFAANTLSSMPDAGINAVVYFKGADTENMFFNSITSAQNNKAVFSSDGRGSVCFKARDIVCRNKETKLAVGNDIDMEMLD